MTDAPLILGIDTALGGASVALCRGEETLASYSNDQRSGQAKMLLVWIEQCLETAKLSYADIDKIAASVGPGGFTGIRIGLAAARALAHATKTPIVGFSTNDLLAFSVMQGQSECEPLLTVLPAGRGKYFVQMFGGGDAAHTQPQMVDDTALSVWCAAAKNIISTVELPEITADVQLYDAQKNAYLLTQLASVGHAQFNEKEPVPLYVRPADAKAQAPMFARM